MDIREKGYAPERPVIPELLRPEIRFLLVFGKGQEVMRDPLTKQLSVKPTEETLLTGAATGYVYEANPRPAENKITILNLGGITDKASTVAESDLLEEIELSIADIPPEQLVRDRSSKGTLQNAEQAAAILLYLDVRQGEVATITDEDHEKRVSRDLKQVGIEVAQQIAFESVLQNKPGYEERVKKYRNKRKQLRIVVETKIIDLFDQSTAGQKILRRFSERRGGHQPGIQPTEHKLANP